MSVSGACLVAKMLGMLHVREDATPPRLEWLAIDQLRTIQVPLATLTNLQALKDLSPKMMLRVLYKLRGEPEEKDLRLSFSNRPTMNNIKEALQTIVARLKTIIRDTSATPALSEDPRLLKEASSRALATPQPSTPQNLMNFADPTTLTDASLLKNHQLQQKLLLEDKALRNVFTQSVINFKLSPAVFWSTRLSQLRTYALTISQHRGPYNVLSTIKPVATSDNQVNVNVTRDTINEIFDTYPVIRKAFSELVPTSIQEGEFWSRFFNSKLFRRLRGDKINTSNSRGDVILDKYIYVDLNYIERDGAPAEDERHINKLLDLQGNAEDNSQKLGNQPDITMRYSEEALKEQNNANVAKEKAEKGGHENEMIILMKNMNKLSSKMIDMNAGAEYDSQLRSESRGDETEYQMDLNLNDLNETEELKYVTLNLSSNHTLTAATENVQKAKDEDVQPAVLSAFLTGNVFLSNDEGINLKDTYDTKNADIERTASEVTALVKQNFRTVRSLNHRDAAIKQENEILPEAVVQELITFNITVMEFLSHFWRLFLGGNNPNQLKKIFASLKTSKQHLATLVGKISGLMTQNPAVSNNERLKEKLVKDLENCVVPLENGLDRACGEYIRAVKELEAEELNENGKRPLVE